MMLKIAIVALAIITAFLAVGGIWLLRDAARSKDLDPNHARAFASIGAASLAAAILCAVVVGKSLPALQGSG